MTEIIEKLEYETQKKMTITASKIIDLLESKDMDFSRSQQALILKHLCDTFQESFAININSIKVTYKR